MKHFLWISIVLLFVGCNRDVKNDKEDTLSIIKSRGMLNVSLDYNATSYFIYRGYPMGFQLELIKQFAETLGVDVHVVPSNSIPNNLNLLKNFQIDIIASDLTPDEAYGQNVLFSEPWLYSGQILVQRKDHAESGDTYIDSVAELKGKTIYVKNQSSAFFTVEKLNQRLSNALVIKTMDSVDDEELMAMVSRGEINYAVCPAFRTQVCDIFYKNLDFHLVLTDSQPVCWAFRSTSDSLSMLLNRWMSNVKNTRQYQSLYEKYFTQSRYIKTNNHHYDLSKGKISAYDDVIKKQAKQFYWDWRLLAALIYQESNFDHAAKSWTGAFGLMQLMPETALRFGIDSTSSPEEMICAGIKLIRSFDKIFIKSINDSNERIKFVLASYNVGAGHILDAQRLAVKYGKDPHIWEDNVESCILLKSTPKYYNDPVVRNGYCRGQEVYEFVHDILDLYHHYKNLTE